MYKFLTLIILTALIVSCDTKFRSEGRVIDQSTRQPIDSVKIYLKNINSVYTDSLGKYKIDTMIYGYAGDLEILLAKNGYKTKHVGFKTDAIKKDSTLIELEKLTGFSEDFCLNQKTVSQLFYFNKFFISSLNILTLMFLIFRKRVKWRFLWILGVLLINLTIFISFTDCSISDFKLINGPIYLTHYWFYPYSVKIVIPIVTVVFWCIYLIKKRILFKTENQ